MREPSPFPGRFEQVDTKLDELHGALWLRMHSTPIACYSLELLSDLLAITKGLAGRPDEVRYVVLASEVEGVFNFGGDLALFSLLSRARDVAGLVTYGQRCLDNLFFLLNAPQQNLVSISLVQGDALGGGLESALAAQVVVAEKGCAMGFPEVKFNLFPGMGAWQLVTRKAGAAVASKMILSGQVFAAEQLHEWGLVDVLAEKGGGEEAVRRFIADGQAGFVGQCGAHAARNTAFPLNQDSFYEVVNQWAEVAVRVSERDRRVMQKLVRAQLKKTLGTSSTGAVEALLAGQVGVAMQMA